MKDYAKWKELSKVKRKSIELGFNGEIIPELEVKWKSTNKVRTKLLVTWILISIMLIGSILFISEGNLYFIPIGIIMFIAYIKYYIIINDILKVRNERWEKYLNEHTK